MIQRTITIEITLNFAGLACGMAAEDKNEVLVESIRDMIALEWPDSALEEWATQIAGAESVVMDVF